MTAPAPIARGPRSTEAPGAAVNVHPALLPESRRRHRLSVYRAYALLQLADPGRSGYVGRNHAREVLGRCYAPRTIDHLLAQGEGLFWTSTTTQRLGKTLRLAAGLKIAEALGMDPQDIRASTVRVPVDNLLGKKTWRAALHTAELTMLCRRGHPMARSTLRGLTGVPETTQRRYNSQNKQGMRIENRDLYAMVEYPGSYRRQRKQYGNSYNTGMESAPWGQAKALRRRQKQRTPASETSFMSPTRFCRRGTQAINLHRKGFIPIIRRFRDPRSRVVWWEDLDARQTVADIIREHVSAKNGGLYEPPKGITDELSLMNERGKKFRLKSAGAPARNWKPPAELLKDLRACSKLSVTWIDGSGGDGPGCLWCSGPVMRGVAVAGDGGGKWFVHGGGKCLRREVVNLIKLMAEGQGAGGAYADGVGPGHP